MIAQSSSMKRRIVAHIRKLLMKLPSSAAASTAAGGLKSPAVRWVLLLLLAAIFGTVSWTLTKPIEPPNDIAPPEVDQPQVAICLVGGLRSFELTGYSIRQFLLPSYPSADLFLHVPLDQDTFKLSILLPSKTKVNFAGLRIISQVPLNESGPPKAVLQSAGSPNAIQGLLQYFELVQGCEDLIAARESRTGLLYSWVLRTRVDSFWSSPAPPLTAYDPTKYAVPKGSSFGGFNDRFGMGNRTLSSAAFTRLRWLPTFQALGLKQLNSEKAFARQMALSNISAQLLDLPFCILGRRSYGYPLQRFSVPVFSLTSEGPLSGAKCQPCHAVKTGGDARQELKKLKGSFGGVAMDVPTDYHLCNASKGWPADWSQVFDFSAGRRAADVRKDYTDLSFGSCVKKMGVLQRAFEDFQGPTPEVLCLLGDWGAFSTFGKKENSWPVFMKPLLLGGTVFAINPGVSFDWELGLENSSHVNVQVLSPAKFVDDGVGSTVGHVKVTSWDDASSKTEDIPDVRVVAKVLAKAFEGGGSKALDVLKVDFFGKEVEVLTEVSKVLAEVPACQVIISVNFHDWPTNDVGKKLGLTLIKCIDVRRKQSRCIYLSLSNCLHESTP